MEKASAHKSDGFYTGNVRCSFWNEHSKYLFQYLNWASNWTTPKSDACGAGMGKVSLDSFFEKCSYNAVFITVDTCFVARIFSHGDNRIKYALDLKDTNQRSAATH